MNSSPYLKVDLSRMSTTDLALATELINLLGWPEFCQAWPYIARWARATSL